MGVVARPRKVNLGCGPGRHSSDWVHVDGSWNARLARLPRLRRLLGALGIIPPEIAVSEWTPGIVTADLRQRLPFVSESIDCIYASHVLEHLYEDEARALLMECRRVLTPSGVLRLVVPDLFSLAQRYMAAASERRHADARPPAADQFNDDLHLRPRTSRNGHPVFRVYSAMTEFHTHKWMYDAESLIARVQGAGFADVDERRYLESRIPGIGEVEQAGRVLDGAGICVEAVKRTP
jgi:predicted SAM-dependent methyltransferase